MNQQGTFRMVKVERDYGDQPHSCDIAGCHGAATHFATSLVVGDPGAERHETRLCYRHSRGLVRRMVAREWDCSYPSSLEG